ncbi:Hypothetical predicted protein [Olea europaea subsp. europaea]|uniref:Uncharacterized protein n=1 Tax=Olea europaea subsp. europaea TaxID=158383 RepID=A0A8S0QF14_OLEEU|nr:Hypothetical predicted protein [Olea europaea subsp. europaea]
MEEEEVVVLACRYSTLEERRGEEREEREWLRLASRRGRSVRASLRRHRVTPTPGTGALRLRGEAAKIMLRGEAVDFLVER